MNHEALLRLSTFLGVALALALAEALAPRLARPAERRLRWPANLGLVAVSTLVIRLSVPVLPVGLAALAQAKGWGLFNLLAALGLPLPEPAAGLCAILLLDCAIYWQHVASHRWRWFWRLHRVHHADTVLDLTTAVRFHPLEMLASLAYKLLLVLALGPPAWAVLAFELLLNALPMFNHANVRLPLALDRALRLALVTPDMHRVHHSADMREANTNFGFCFPWWDRLFATYLDQPALGHAGMTIGLTIFRDRAWAGLWGLLRMPFA
ncbi:MAG: sterol desaturase family protein [Humidesulfovibrio sp.]|uniref:sterol desaturase family protein n=1 Tax=Humidesulfovibrio sp. TaxID=2910988 RepID=UPI0027F73283|nr:sterol desaturase family protein [Humidesulfovibrio sp.]MDQ7836364.1 sterol desaturase family protein [Humidesulfovibrio sp.]